MEGKIAQTNPWRDSHQQDVWYLVETIIHTVRNKHGLRGAVHDIAAAKGAFHSDTDIERRRSIAYTDTHTLSVRVLFTHRSVCGVFQSALERAVRRVFDAEAAIAHNRVYSPVHVCRAIHPFAVLPSDYTPSAESDSEEDEDSLCASPDSVAVDAEMQPLLWEDVTLSRFRWGTMGRKCRLLSRREHPQLAENANNILIMSGENGYRFAGGDRATDTPCIAIRFIGTSSARENDGDNTVTVKGEQLTLCDIAIECMDEEVYRCVSASVKRGTTSDAQTLSFFTSVAAPDPVLFGQFLTHKYLETKARQRKKFNKEGTK